jgi:hypothetical protein
VPDKKEKYYGTPEVLSTVNAAADRGSVPKVSAVRTDENAGVGNSMTLARVTSWSSSVTELS